MTETLNVAQVCADRGIAPGGTKGAARHLAGVAGGLSRRGHTVRTYTQRPSEGPHPVPVVDLAALVSSRPDVVYERYSLSSGAGLAHARAVGASFVLELNAPLVEEATRHRPDTVDQGALAREIDILASADVVITVSRQLAKWARRFRQGRIMVIQNGFEPGWFPTPVRHQPGDQRLVFLGHPKPWHGANRIPVLIDLLNQRGHDPSVLVVGGGDGTAELLDYARRLGVESQIEITGPVAPEEASRLVATAAVGVAPYPLQPNFYFSPLKILDYLAAGLPVVSTNQGDIADLVGNAGIVVEDPDDDRAMANAIALLLEDPTLRSRMGNAGRERAFSALSWDHVAEQTVTALNLARREVAVTATRGNLAS